MTGVLLSSTIIGHVAIKSLESLTWSEVLSSENNEGYVTNERYYFMYLLLEIRLLKSLF